MKNSQVNSTVARDLVSNAGSKVGDMNDFEHGKTLLNNRAGLDSESRQVEEDLRSVRSEYDYGSKRKFLDVLGNVSNTAKLNRLRAQHEIEKAGNPGALSSVKNSHQSRVSYASKLSKMSAGQLKKAQERKTKLDAAPIVEEGPDDVDIEATPEDFIACNSCLRELSQDEKIINARFVNEGIAACRDISAFPICI